MATMMVSLLDNCGRRRREKVTQFCGKSCGTSTENTKRRKIDPFVGFVTLVVGLARVTDQDVVTLVALFDEALKLPANSGITEPIECPLCGTESALTPGRVQRIRQHVEGTKDFKMAETAAKSALTGLRRDTSF